MKKNIQSRLFIILFSLFLLTSCKPSATANNPILNEIAPSLGQEETLSPTIVVATQESVIFEEKFDGATICFDEFEQQGNKSERINQSYYLQIMDLNSIVHSKCEGNIISGGIVEVELQILSEPSSQSSYYYGVTIRTNQTERYAFVIGNSGGYCAYYATENVYEPLTGSTDFITPCWVFLPENSINEAGANKFRIEMRTQQFSFYLNDVLLTVIRDSKLSEGQVGIIIATGEQGGVILQVKHLIVTE